jgi:hypothetical protein
MDGFRNAGFKRPKLKEKLDVAKAQLGVVCCPACTPANAHSP